MIADVDDTLKELLVQKVPIDPAAIDIKFEMPTEEWAGGITRPTINLFLYDLRENHELRDNQRQVTRGDAVPRQLPAPLRFDLTYLITSWASDVADEHQLLGNVLGGILRYPIWPAEVLKGAMTTQPFPVRAWIAQPERTPNSWEFWSRLDGRLKAGISYAVTIALDATPAEEVVLVTEKVIKLREGVGP
jgi:hypothetical protein